MKRFRSLTCLTIPAILLLTFSSLLADPGLTKGTPGQAVTISQMSPNQPDWAPTFTLPHDTALKICAWGQVCYPISGSDVDAGDSLKLTLVSGPITYTPWTFGQQFTTTICFTPANSGAYRFIWKLTDKQSHVVIDTVTYTVTVDQPPTISNQSFKSELCYQPYEVVLNVVASDPESDPLTYHLLSGPGSIDATTGQLTFTPTGAGVYSFLVSVNDKCGADTATITDSVKINLPPYLTWRDSTLRVCNRSEICFDAKAHDPEGGPVTVNLVNWPSGLNGTTDSLGHVCFTPNADSATYVFAFCLGDVCPLDSGWVGKARSPICFPDTVRYTVIVNKKPTIACPGPQKFFACQPDSFCFNISATDPEGGPVTFSVLSGNAKIEGNKVCVAGNGTNQSFNVVIAATDNCWLADTCTVPVEITGSRPPYVTIAKDFSVSVCQAQDVCLMAYADDPDLNLKNVIVNYGTYNKQTNQICFHADTSGVYHITMEAIDSCGLTAIGSVNVTVQVNQLPTVHFEKHTDSALCFAGQLCYNVAVTDNNLKNLYTSIGTYDKTTGKLCFTPDTSGLYRVVVTAVDDCDKTAADTLMVRVTINHPPVITGLRDTTIYLCAPINVCLPAGVTDQDNNITSITVNRGKYANGSICFVPYNQGKYPVIMTVVDACGATVVDTAWVTIHTDQEVVIGYPKDTTIALCSPDTLCFPVTGVPSDAKVKLSGTNVWWDAQKQSVCFYSNCCLQNTINVQITTACGTIKNGTFTVKVQTNTPPLVLLPQDTTIGQCAGAPVCFPVAISDIDHNVATVVVTGATYDAYRQTACLTPDSAGVYLITVRATDSCGAVGTRSMRVTVRKNNPPSISFAPTDTLFSQCTPSQICLPINVSDLDGNLKSVTTSLGTYNPSTKSICFTPSQAGRYCFTATATDSCGLEANATLCVQVNFGDFVALQCPKEWVVPFTLCNPDTICIPIQITGTPSHVITSLGIYKDGKICFKADTSGGYAVKVVAQAGCNSDSCSFVVPVIIQKPVKIACGVSDTTLFLCANTDTLKFPVSVTGDAVQLTVTPSNAVYSNGFIYFTGYSTGSYTIKVVGKNSCNSDSCSFAAHIKVNQPPMLTFVKDTSIVECGALGEVRLRYGLSDPDNNITQIRTTLGVIDDTSVFFTPTQSGDYTVIISAIDACGARVADTAVVHLSVSPKVTIVCPGAEIPVSVKLPDTVRIKIPVTPTNANVTVHPNGRYDATTGEVVIYVDSASVRSYTLIAVGPCNADTCNFSINVHEYIPPHVSCIGSIDTLVCVTPNDTVCLPVTVTGDSVQVKVLPTGIYQNGHVCFPVSQAGTYPITVIAYNAHNADTCHSSLTVRGGHKPTIILPSPIQVYTCVNAEVCFSAHVSDSDGDLVSVTTSKGTITRGPDSVRVCFIADGPIETFPRNFGTYRIVLTATDACGLSNVDTMLVSVVTTDAPTVDLGPDKTVHACAGSQICVPVVIISGNGPEQDSLIAIGGVVDSVQNHICFAASEAGIHRIIARVADKCGRSMTDTVDITVILNTPPTISNFRDTTLYLCAPKNVCLPITINDADHNIKTITTNRGSYSNGTVCFAPYSMGTYPVIVTVTDSCGLSAVDTAIVTVLTDQQVNITYPKDTSIFQCKADTLCFAVGGVPSDATVKVTGTNVWWDKQKQSVCFYSDCCLQNSITVAVTTACGTIKTGMFTVKVQTNSAPLVILPPDTSITECSPTKLCFAVGVRDIDNNLMSINVTGATYNAQAQTMCFTPTGAGTYTITVKATDSCGAVAQRNMVVTIHDNVKPVISYVPHDTLYSQCTFSQICLPVGVTDPDGNLTSVTVLGGTYNAQAGTVCFTPTDTGRVCVTVIAKDQCGLADTLGICVHVISGGAAHIQCPGTPYNPTNLCKPDSVCAPLTITGHNFTVASSIGIYKNGMVCFKADTSGTYTIKVVATGQCASDSCTLTVPVQILPAVKVTCPGNQTVFLCGPDTVCYPFTTSASVTSVRVVGVGYVNGNQVCLPVVIAGSRTIQLIATGQCGADTCSFTFTASFNQVPTITAKDTTLTVCSLSQVCVPFTAADVNHNIQSITTTVGQINGSSVCLTPTVFGETDLTLTVTDSCGAQATRLVKVIVNQGLSAKITCPDGDQFVSICKPDSVYIIAPISPASATVTILPSGKYNPSTGRIAIYVTQGGTYAVTVIAAAQCHTDTCHFNLRVDMGQAPVISCPGEVDTTLCLVKPDTLCFPVTVSGTGAQVVVSPAGYYSAGTVCVPISTAGAFYVKMSVSGTCGTSACSTLVNVKANLPPVVNLPVVSTIQRCPKDTNTICISGISATDPEGKPVTLSMLCGSGTFTTPAPGQGQICFKPSSIQNQMFCIQATDGCQTVVDTLTVPIVQRSDCDVCVKATIDGGVCSVVGVVKTVNIDVTSYDRIGGFELLFKFDPSALSFRAATITGTSIDGWEYFTYNLNNGSCGSSCPAGLVRLIGLAEVNNGAHHPPDSTLQPNGLLVKVDFLISNDQNLGGQFVPIQWVWYDCSDNSFSDPTGNYLSIDNRIYNAEKILTWDENDKVNFPEASRPFGVGAPATCLVSGGKSVPQRCVEFFDGGICIIHPDSIDSRGDINLNNVAYEVGDAVMFTNYFIRGLNAFGDHIAGSVAASDVNADGMTLTVADLTYLIRVVIGDATPIKKIAPFEQKMVVKAERQNGVIRLSTNTVSSIGTAFFVLNAGSNTTMGDPTLADAARSMDLKFANNNGQLRVLVYNIGKNKIQAGENTILEIPYTGDGIVSVDEADAADYDGQPYLNSGKVVTLPSRFALSQNYPNPFNPTTKISFSLPTATSWTLSVYNVSGSLVKEFNGNGDAGNYEVEWDGRSQSGTQTASGVYFYRLVAGNFSRTMKMILLK